MRRRSPISRFLPGLRILIFLILSGYSGMLFGGISSVSGGYQHSLYLKSDGSLWGMGLNSSGQLGDGSSTSRSTPAEVVTVVSNQAPTDLNSSAFLTILENQIVGTEVGDFNATDPDENATLIYSLVSGVGDSNNSLFTMESN